MFDNDFQEFQKHWLACCQVAANSNRPNDFALNLIFEDLIEYPLEIVIYALRMHRKTDKFAPTVSDIERIIKDNYGLNHPTADEAWAVVLESLDENKTVVWTQQMAEARAIAWNVYEESGLIAARMTFKEAYSRILKATHTPPRWDVCFGADKNDRIRVVEKAVLKNLLPKSRLESLQIEHKPAEVNFLQLVDMSGSKFDKNAAKQKLEALKRVFSSANASDYDPRKEAEQLRKDFETRKADQLQRVNQVLEQRGEPLIYGVA